MAAPDDVTMKRTSPAGRATAPGEITVWPASEGSHEPTYRALPIFAILKSGSRPKMERGRSCRCPRRHRPDLFRHPTRPNSPRWCWADRRRRLAHRTRPGVSRCLLIGHFSALMPSANRIRPNAESLWERYDRLSPGPKTVLRLKSLVFLSTNKSAFLDCLIRSGLRTPEGRAWAGPATNTALEALRRDDLLDVDHTCPPALLHPVAIDAVASPEGERMVAAVRRAFPSLVSGQHYARPQETNPEPLIRLARLAVYANDEDGFIAERDRHDSALAPQRLTTALGALLAPAPFAPDWIDSRAPAIQAGLFEGRIAALLSGHLAIPGLAELIARYRKLQDGPGFAPVRRALLAHDVLALRLDAAGDALAKLDAADAPLRLAAEATLRFLAGQNARAIGLYRAALKELRKQAGKRKLFLDGAHGLFFLMALLRANDATLHAEIQAGIDVLPLNQRPHRAGWLGLQMLLWLAQGLEGKARELLDRLKDFRPPTGRRMPAWRWRSMPSIRTAPDAGKPSLPPPSPR